MPRTIAWKKRYQALERLNCNDQFRFALFCVKDIKFTSKPTKIAVNTAKAYFEGKATLSDCKASYGMMQDVLLKGNAVGRTSKYGKPESKFIAALCISEIACFSGDGNNWRAQCATAQLAEVAIQVILGEDKALSSKESQKLRKHFMKYLWELVNADKILERIFLK